MIWYARTSARAPMLLVFELYARGIWRLSWQTLAWTSGCTARETTAAPCQAGSGMSPSYLQPTVETSLALPPLATVSLEAVPVRITGLPLPSSLVTATTVPVCSL